MISHHPEQGCTPEGENEDNGLQGDHESDVDHRLKKPSRRYCRSPQKARTLIW